LGLLILAHSEIILYRPGYEEFKRFGNCDKYFGFVHSEGELENAVSINIDKRRIYIDTEEDIVYSMNTQYGGNTIGLKKLAMRVRVAGLLTFLELFLQCVEKLQQQCWREKL